MSMAASPTLGHASAAETGEVETLLKSHVRARRPMKQRDLHGDDDRRGDYQTEK